METCEELFRCDIQVFIQSPRFSKTTAAAYASAMKVFLRWCAAGKLTKPTEQDMVAYRSFLLSRYRLTTAQSYFAAVRLFFSWMGKHGLYEDIASDVKGISVNRSVPLRDYLTGQDMMDVLSRLKKKALVSDQTSDIRDYVMVLLMVCCGLRVTEVTRLDVGDIVQTSGGNQILVRGKGRDGKSDQVNVPDEVMDAIHQWLAARGAPTKREPLFISLGARNHGGRLCARTVSQIAKRALVGAGFDSPRLTAHSLRHTAVTLALLGGANLQEAQQFARHSRIETTQIYAHNLEASRNRCSRLVAQMVIGGKKRNQHVLPKRERLR